MRLAPASTLLTLTMIAAILPPGYAAYIGAYVALALAGLALLVYGWRDRSAFVHPSSLAIFAALGLITITLPFVYRGEQDILAPVFILPMLIAVAMGVLARRADPLPSAMTLAWVCLAASALAVIGGAYEHYILDVYRPGLGNNPIHYASLAGMSGCLALVGVVSGASRSRYVFLLGPIFALAAAGIADSRGPMAGVLAMSGIGVAVLSVWLWKERLFRLTLLAGAAVAILVVVQMVLSGNSRIISIFESGLNVFKFTGSSDDIRAALYASALDAIGSSPLFGIGFGQIMPHAETMFPALVEPMGLDNLHADWANFAAMAGVMGLCAWLLLLAAPLLLLRSSQARADRPTVLGVILIVTGQIVLGISNATFGILPQTVIYAAAFGYLFARARGLEYSTLSETRP
jgi:O-antigen ligase